jgi:hypothetical protein
LKTPGSALINLSIYEKNFMTNEISERLKTPARGLIITGLLNAVLGITVTTAALIQTLNGKLNRDFANDDERYNYLVGFFTPSVVGIISLILAPVIIFGGIKMLKGRNRNLAICAAVLATIPLTSCCFAAGSIFGVWALVVLMKPEVKAFFRSST